MKKHLIPDARIETQYVNFFGGLDMASSVLSIKPGSALEAVNYEPGMNGGYKRIDGYERFDGRMSPSSASYLYLEGELIGEITTGVQVMGATSGATAMIILVDTEQQALIVTRVAGDFIRGEQMTIAGNVVGTILLDPSPRGYRDAEHDAIALAAAADYYRNFIGPVPGQGPVRGVWMFGGVCYAFRDAVGGATCGMYKSTPTGWVPVALGRQLQVEQPSKTVTTSGGAVNWAGHGLAAGDLVRLTGTLPSNSAANTSYYVVNPLADTFQLAATAGGAAIALGNVASGLTALPQAKQIKDGDTITGATSGATAVVTRAGLRTGDWLSFGATATITMASATGAFQADEVLTVGGKPVMNAKTADAAITLAPGGRYEFVTYNFTGSADTRRMYGCDGVNPAFEFDGSVFVPILTGMDPENPKFIAAWKSKLWLTYKGSLQHSGDGTPYNWTVLSGADELGIGDTITGLAVQAGDTLAVYGRSTTFQLNGSTNADFQMLPIAPDVGALPYSVQVVGKTYALDDRGIVVMDRTQAYGNFVQGTISQAAQPIMDKLRTTIMGSVAYRNRNQLRMYDNIGGGIIATFNDAGLIGITRLRYPVKPQCFASCEDGSGAPVVFFGDENGYVYQADRGSSFDGQDIDAYLRMPFNNISSPRLRKRFRKAVLEITSTGYSSIRFQPEFSDGNADVYAHRLQIGETGGTAGYWDVDNWDEFYYDASLATSPEFSIEGSGLSMALLFYNKSAIDLGHTLQGLLIHFSPRRLAR